jgi:hypothetical protein
MISLIETDKYGLMDFNNLKMMLLPLDVYLEINLGSY